MSNKIKLSALALTPFIVGNIINWLAFKSAGSSFVILSVLFFVYWFFIGSISKKYTNSAIQSMLIGNSFGGVCIILLLFSGIVLRSYFAGTIGLQLQMYFLPAIKLSTIFIQVFKFNINSNMIFLVSFILMIITYFAGYSISFKRT